jgi:phosphate transport system permease protein
MAALSPLADSVTLVRRDRARRVRSALALHLVRFSAIATILMIAAIIGTIVVKGAPAIDWDFLSSPPVEGMSSGGIWPMLRGSILLMAGTIVLAPVVGILGGVWLACYLGQSRLARVVRSLIATLAGTPSIIFGLFGLAIFVLKFGLGFSLIAGWLTLAMMSVPVVMLTTESAIRSVPDPFEEAGLALGLSKWQTIRRVVLPSAMPGIMTGLVLSAGRAAGEAPPILLTAGIYYSTEKLSLSWETLTKPVANLPYHLAEGYRQGGVIPEKIIWGTCLSLMAFVLLVNLGAIVVRARARSKQRW